MRPYRRRLDHYLGTIAAIVSSPKVKHFVIGMTGQALWDRRTAYYAKGCRHTVILADKMLGFNALELEASLHERCFSDRKSVLYRKYHPNHRVARRRPGGGTQSLGLPVYSVYLAWWDRNEISN